MSNVGFYSIMSLSNASADGKFKFYTDNFMWHVLICQMNYLHSSRFGQILNKLDISSTKITSSKIDNYN